MPIDKAFFNPTNDLLNSKSVARQISIVDPKLIKYSKDWWYNILPALAAEPFNPSITEILKALKIKSYTVEGATIEGTKILAAYKLISTLNRSDLVASQIKTPAISSAACWPIYAYKHQQAISYDRWDRSDPALKHLLGSSLSWLIDYQDWDISQHFDMAELLRIREEATTAKGTGVKAPYTSNKMVSTSNAEFNKLPRLLKYMVLQTWIYHPSIRSTETMILNWSDWSALPPYTFDDEVINNPETAEEFDLW